MNHGGHGFLPGTRRVPWRSLRKVVARPCRRRQFLVEQWQIALSHDRLQSTKYIIPQLGNGSCESALLPLLECNCTRLNRLPTWTRLVICTLLVQPPTALLSQISSGLVTGSIFPFRCFLQDSHGAVPHMSCTRGLVRPNALTSRRSPCPTLPRRCR